MLWIFAERFFMAALRQCEKSEGCFAVFTAQPWTAAVLFKLQFSDGLLDLHLGSSFQQAAGVRMRRTFGDLLGRSYFNNLSAVHYGNTGSQIAHDRHGVRNE